MSCNDKPIKICTQTNIPQVDNSELECQESGFVKSSCVVFPQEITYLGLSENTDLTTFTNSLISSLIDVRNRLLIAEEKIANLESSNN